MKTTILKKSIIALTATAVSTALFSTNLLADDHAAKTSKSAKTAMKYSRLQQLSKAAPIAKKVPHEQEFHGIKFNDPYFWLRDADYPKVDDKEVLDYLVKENDYFNAFLEPNRKLADTIFEEFKGRTDEQETSVPTVKNGYEYRWYFKKGQEYRTYVRKNLKTGEEQVYLDLPELAKGSEYFVMGGMDISPDNRYLAYTVDTAGDERYQAFVKDLTTGEMVGEPLNDVSGGVEFGADGQSFLYALLEKDRWHAKHIMAHKLNTPQKDDHIVYKEANDSFFLGFGKTSSEKFMVIYTVDSDAHESYILPADDLFAKPILFVSRDQKFLHSIDHAHDYFYVLANDTHSNFRLAKVKDSAPEYKNWETIEAGSDDIYLIGLKTFEDFIAIKSRDKGYEKIRILDYKGKQHFVEFPENVFTASFGNNPAFDQDFIRLSYESMITPDTVFDYDIKERKLNVRKEKNIPSGYDKSQYVTERIMATARDGVKVPVSIVYKKGFKQDGSQPMHLYAYGAYGNTVDPGFSTMRLSLLDRGFSYAIAHPRGGSMLGHNWYLEGKLKKRNNTFNDFVDVAKHLVKQNYVEAGNISISGRSAGGELMGAVVVQDPDLWRSVILGVPFVDVLNTMLDATLPLTPPEWSQWGNPIKSKEDFELIQGYSPYDNIEKREYPPMLVSGGLNDPRVTYWEPAKWTAKMRDMKTDNNLLIMRINMGAGHFANSGRYGRLKDYAEEYAFILRSHDIDK